MSDNITDSRFQRLGDGQGDTMKYPQLQIVNKDGVQVPGATIEFIPARERTPETDLCQVVIEVSVWLNRAPPNTERGRLGQRLMRAIGVHNAAAKDA